MPQVSVEHYFRADYIKKGRWVSYWHQIDEVLRTRPETCLEIGVGNGLVRAYLRSAGIRVVTVDIDPGLEPDRVGDVRELPCGDGEFDVLLCAQVLEHIPFHDVPKAVDELARVARHRAVVSVPQCGRAVAVSVHLPVVGGFMRVAKLPSRRRFEFDGQHYWEAGSRNHPVSSVRRALCARFALVNEYLVPEFAYHRFFILSKTR